MKDSYLYSALVAAVNISIERSINLTCEDVRENYYGVPKGGYNDCARANNDGETQSYPADWLLKDNDPYTWPYLDKKAPLQRKKAISSTSRVV